MQYPDLPLNFQFAWRATYWPFSLAATNAYAGDGSCAGVVKPTCLRQLRALNASGVGLPQDLPACQNVTARWGGAASCALNLRAQ